MERGVHLLIKSLAVALLLTGLVVFLISVGSLVKLVVISALLAYALDPLVSRIESYGLGRTGATALLFCLLAVILGVGFLTFIPFLTSEVINLSGEVGQEQTQALFSLADESIKKFLAFFGIENLSLSGKFAEWLVSASNSLLSNLLDMLTLLTYVLFIPFIVFFLLKDGRSIKKYLISMVPNRYFELTCNLLYKMDMQLGNYFRGQFIDALIIGTLSVIALLILDVKYALFIGILAGIANMIPYIGPISGAMVAMVITFIDTGDGWLLLYIALAFAIVQLIDNIVVQPAVIARNVDLPPLVVLLAVIVGGKLFGIIGMLISVPVTAILKVSLQEGFKVYRQYRFN